MDVPGKNIGICQKLYKPAKRKIIVFSYIKRNKNMKRYLLLIGFYHKFGFRLAPDTKYSELPHMWKQKKLPKSWVYLSKKNYVYLALDNQYIHSLYPIIQNFDNKSQKPPYFRKTDPIGSHVSVMYEKETETL